MLLVDAWGYSVHQCFGFLGLTVQGAGTQTTVPKVPIVMAAIKSHYYWYWVFRAHLWPSEASLGASETGVGLKAESRVACVGRLRSLHVDTHGFCWTFRSEGLRLKSSKGHGAAATSGSTSNQLAVGDSAMTAEHTHTHTQRVCSFSKDDQTRARDYQLDSIPYFVMSTDVCIPCHHGHSEGLLQPFHGDLFPAFIPSVKYECPPCKEFLGMDGWTLGSVPIG